MSASKSPPAFIAGGLGCLLRSLWPSTSNHHNPPAWRFHDGGDGGDGGGSASMEKLRESALRVKFSLIPWRFHSFQAHFTSFAERLPGVLPESFQSPPAAAGHAWCARGGPALQSIPGRALSGARSLMPTADSRRIQICPAALIQG